MRTEIQVRDLFELFEYLTAANAQYALAGGLAVGLWADKLFVEEERERCALPLYSEDVDLSNDASRLQAVLADGRFSLPPDFAEAGLVHSAIAAALN